MVFILAMFGSPHIHIHDDGDVFKQASQCLAELLKSDVLTLVLLSGGSAIKTYSPIADAIQSGNKNLIIGMVDERYDEVGHKDSNARAIAEAFDLWNLCQKNGVECREILQGKSFEQTVHDYELWLGDRLTEVRRSIAVLGIGADGHTAGILPFPKEEFDTIFETDRLAVGYNAPGQFALRITVTPHLLSRVSHAILVGQGRDKLNAFNLALKSPDESSLHDIPASIIHQMPDVQVFISAG